MNLSKGFNNIFSPTLTNFIIALILVIIVILVYIKNKNIDLFGVDDNNDYDNYLQSIISKYQAKKIQKNKFAISLATQEERILDLQSQADNLFSSF